MSLSVQFRSVN